MNLNMNSNAERAHEYSLSNRSYAAPPEDDFEPQQPSSDPLAVIQPGAEDLEPKKPSVDDEDSRESEHRSEEPIPEESEENENDESTGAPRFCPAYQDEACADKENNLSNSNTHAHPEAKSTSAYRALQSLCSEVLKQQTHDEISVHPSRKLAAKEPVTGPATKQAKKTDRVARYKQMCQVWGKSSFLVSQGQKRQVGLGRPRVAGKVKQKTLAPAKSIGGKKPLRCHTAKKDEDDGITESQRIQLQLLKRILP